MAAPPEEASAPAVPAEPAPAPSELSPAVPVDVEPLPAGEPALSPVPPLPMSSEVPTAAPAEVEAVSPPAGVTEEAAPEEAPPIVALLTSTRIRAAVPTALRAARRSKLPWQLAVGALAGLAVLLALLRLLPSHASTSAAGGPAAPPAAQATSTSAPSAPAPASSGGSLNNLAARSLPVSRVLGEAAGLSKPQEAAPLENGRIAVIDTGNKRIVLLSSAGQTVKSVTSGAAPLQEPYAIATSGSTLYVLDSGRGAIESYDLAGRFQKEIIHDPLLHEARGMALGPNGTLYVANPGTNSVLALSTAGAIVHQVSGPIGSGATQLNQPSDVAASRNGRIYVLDNNNARIQIMSAPGSFTGRLPAPQSSTLFSAHVLPLPDGRLLVSDPSSASLLLYPSGSGAPTRLNLRLKGASSAQISPLGMARAANGDILVIDSMGGRILVIPPIG